MSAANMTTELPTSQARPSLCAAPGSVVALPNDTKIRFCNALDGLRRHWLTCDDCAEYLYWGEGDLCSKGKDIIAEEMAYADTSIEFPPNGRTERREAAAAQQTNPPGASTAASRSLQ